MLKNILLPDADDVIVESYFLRNGMLEFNMTCIGPMAVCPHCGTVSGRVHSRYVRKPMDLAMVGTKLFLIL